MGVLIGESDSTASCSEVRCAEWSLGHEKSANLFPSFLSPMNRGVTVNMAFTKSVFIYIGKAYYLK